MHSKSRVHTKIIRILNLIAFISGFVLFAANQQLKHEIFYLQNFKAKPKLNPISNKNITSCEWKAEYAIFFSLFSNTFWRHRPLVAITQWISISARLIQSNKSNDKKNTLFSYWNPHFNILFFSSFFLSVKWVCLICIASVENEMQPCAEWNEKVYTNQIPWFHLNFVSKMIVMND